MIWARRSLLDLRTWTVYGSASSGVLLEHGFQKWGVSIGTSRDTMLSLKRKRQSVGKDAGFQYRGRDVERERIERAWKRAE